MNSLSASAISEIAAWIQQRLTIDGTPGLSLSFTNRDGLFHSAAFGLAEIASATPMSPSHLLEIGSIGKSFTAVAMLQLAAEGGLDLQAPVTDYLPWFSVQSEHAPICLHHLLTHTAGIASGLDFAPGGKVQVWALRDAVASTPPGAYFHYSNVGYKVLGEVLQAVTGETYGAAIQKRILDPLKLQESVPTITHAVRERLAVGYGPLYDDRPWWPGRPLAPATWLPGHDR
jgi:D-alanyl-D-alanine carboxypeptidase